MHDGSDNLEDMVYPNTNAKKGKVIEPSDPNDGVYITLNIYIECATPDILFFSSRHADAATQPYSVVQFTWEFAAGPVAFGVAVDARKVDEFASSLEPLAERINNGSTLGSDDPWTARELDDDAEEALEEVERAFEEFMESGEWIDEDIVVIDTTEFWHVEKFREVVKIGVSYEEAVEIAERVEREEGNYNYRILSDGGEVIVDEYFDEEYIAAAPG